MLSLLCITLRCRQSIAYDIWHDACSCVCMNEFIRSLCNHFKRLSRGSKKLLFLTPKAILDIAQAKYCQKLIHIVCNDDIFLLPVVILIKSDARTGSSCQRCLNVLCDIRYGTSKPFQKHLKMLKRRISIEVLLPFQELCPSGYCEVVRCSVRCELTTLNGCNGWNPSILFLVPSDTSQIVRLLTPTQDCFRSWSS